MRLPLKLPSEATPDANGKKSEKYGKIGIMMRLKIGNSLPNEKPPLLVQAPPG
jgi:hypothetical protein